MRFINKAGLLAGALTTLLILASCSDSDTSTGVTTGKQLANDASTEVVMHQGTAGTGEHSNPDTNHGHSPDQQHAEPNNPTTSSVVALLSISNPVCGNLTQEDGEQCDGGLGGNATCNTDCTLKTQRGEIIATAACGNGIVDSGEQCDDANDSNEDDCTRFCKTPVCGDGYVQGSNGEQCDDKNKIDSDSCNNACQSSTTTVVTTTTVIEEVNDDGGTTRTPTTPTNTNNGGGSCFDALPATDPCKAGPGTQYSVSGVHWLLHAQRPYYDYFICLPDCSALLENSKADCPTGWHEIHDELGYATCLEDEVVEEPDSCTFAAIANSDHASTLTYNIGDEWTYTCLSGFHLDDGGDSRVVQSIGYLCTEEAANLDFLPASSCVADEVSCDAEYSSCLNPTEEIPHAETTRCLAEVRQYGQIFFLDSSPDRSVIGQDLSVAQYCERFGSMASRDEREACHEQRNICEGP